MIEWWAVPTLRNSAICGGILAASFAGLILWLTFSEVMARIAGRWAQRKR
jgi:hypothetical protein